MPAGYKIDWHDEWIEENLNRFSSYYSLGKEYNRIFGTNISPYSFKGHAQRALGLQKERQNYHPYSDEQMEFIKENYPKYNVREFQKLFNERFHENRTFYGLKSKARSLGVKVDEEVSNTFRRTNLDKESCPKATKKSGSVRIECGRPIMKDDNGDWKCMARVVYEKEYGPVPKGYTVINLNGDPYDCRLENIAMISMKCHGMMFNYGFRSEDSEVTKTGIKLCELIEAVKNQNKGETR